MAILMFARMANLCAIQAVYSLNEDGRGQTEATNVSLCPRSRKRANRDDDVLQAPRLLLRRSGVHHSAASRPTN